jgi:hypothetical protein
VNDAVQVKSRTSARSSARLGLVLRSVILTPTDGFEAAKKAAERRARAAQRPAEGFTPYVLAAIGGAATLLLWLKLGALVELRDAPRASFRPIYLVGAVGFGATLGLLAQFAWGWLGPALFGSGDPAARRSMRIAWGLAALPQIVAVGVLFPMDLAIVGPQSFTTTGLPDSVATAWAAASIALSVAFAVWTIWLFYTGVKVMVEAGRWRALGGLLVAGGLIAVAFVPLLFGAKVS